MIGAVTWRPRERRLALAAAVLIGCWAFVSWVVQPLWERLRDLRLHVETQTQKLEAVNRLLTSAQSVDAKYRGVAAYLETEDDDRAQGTFLNTLEAMSRDTNIRLNLKPRPMKREDRLSRFEVELDAEGSQSNLMMFLDALLRLPKLLAIERLRLSAVPAKEDELRANLVVQKLTLHQ